MSYCCCDAYHGSVSCADGDRVCKLCGYTIPGPPRIYRVFTTHRNWADRERLNAKNVLARSADEAEQIARKESTDVIKASAMLLQDWIQAQDL